MLRRMMWASMRSRRARVTLALMAVTLGVSVAVALATLSLQVGDDLARSLRAAGPNFVVLPAGAGWPLDLGGAGITPARAGLSLDESAVTALKGTFWRNNVLEAAPEIALDARVGDVPARLLGSWFDRTLPTGEGGWRTGLSHLRPLWRVAGRWPAEDGDELALGRTLATRLHARIGDRVRVAPAAAGVRAPAAVWTVTGIVSAGGLEDRDAWAPLSRVQALAARPGRIDRVWMSALVRPDPGHPPPDAARDPQGYERYMCTAFPEVVARDLAEHVAGAEVLPASEQVAGEGRVVGRLNLLLLLLALAALSASVLGLFSTMTANVIERGVELALLRSLGATPRAIAALLLGETAWVSLAGGVLGWAAGSVAAAVVRGRTFGAAHAAEPLLLPVALVISLAVALLGTLGPLRLALRLDPARVLRG
ncbi:MAG TPA: ABC transporter permease [Candidatus Eisenbacteria bacterium]